MSLQRNDLLERCNLLEMEITFNTNQFFKLTSLQNILILLVLTLMASCVKRSDYVRLKLKNDSLIQKIHDDHEKVKIENSVVKVLDSKHTKESYDIYISYPPNFRNQEKKYPVLIVLDAEVNFGAS